MHFYVHLVDTKFTKWSNFVREAWLIKEKWNKRSCLKPPMNADARRCSAPLIGVHRRFPTVGGMRVPRYVFLVRAKFTNRSNLRQARGTGVPPVESGDLTWVMAGTCHATFRL